MWTFALHGHKKSHAFGRTLGRHLRAGDVVLLHGDLGAGKTVLAQGLAEGLGVTSAVQSPTFTIVQEHRGTTADGESVMLFHLDLYRLGWVDELESIGYERFIEPEDGVSVIEWPERAEDWQPPRCLIVRIWYEEEDVRSVSVVALPDRTAWSTELIAWLDGRSDDHRC